MDNADQDITDSIAVAGLKGFAAVAPTPGSSPHVITYSVADAAGNVAHAARRVNVICPTPEAACVLPSGDVTCSSQGFCLPGLVPVGTPELKPAAIELIGPPVVALSVGTSYGACPKSRPLSLVCDAVRPHRCRFTHACPEHGVSCLDADHGDCCCREPELMTPWRVTSQAESQLAVSHRHFQLEGSVLAISTRVNPAT